MEDLPGHDGHDGGGADGDVLGAAEDAVAEAAHEGGVEAVLGGQARHDGVGDTLGGLLVTGGTRFRLVRIKCRKQVQSSQDLVK